MGHGDDPSGANDDGRDALRHLRFGGRVRIETLGGVVVNIDEARCEHQSLGVDDHIGRAWSGVLDARDATPSIRTFAVRVGPPVPSTRVALTIAVERDACACGAAPRGQHAAGYPGRQRSA